VIKLPRRSVTRFFVPLIDVLILLFCIFLLMPFVSTPAEAPETKEPPKTPLPENVRDLQRELTEARDRLARMEKASQARLADRLSVRVLQIDRKDGTLYYFDPDRQEIRTEADVLKLIARQKTLASSAGGVKDVLFLILYPQEASGFPTKKQEEQIHDWFRDVPHKFQ
jgi:biopolymer transport protein ExbD